MFFNYKKIILILFSTVILFCLSTNFLFANEDLPVYDSVRVLAMGGAGIGVATNEDVIFYNSAGLSYIEKWKLSYNFLTIGFNDDIFKIVDLLKDDEMKDVMDGNIFWADVSDALKDKILRDRRSKLKLGTNVNFMYPGSLFNWGLGFYTASDVDIIMDMGIFVPKLGFKGNGDIMGVFSLSREFNLPIYKEILNPISLGMSLRYLQRYKVDEFRSVEEYDDLDENELFDRGWGLGIDFGVMYRLLDKRLTLAATITDFGGTEMYWDKKGNSVITGRLNLGASYRPTKMYYWKGKYIAVNKLLLAFDINDFGQREDFFNRIHFGLEYNLYKILVLRAGLNQGYPSIGFKFAFLEYTYYGEEMGTFAGQREDWQHVLNISFKF